MGDFIKLRQSMAKSFADLTESVRTGKPLPALKGGFKNQSADSVREFIRAMHNGAVGHAEFLARKLELSFARTLLDVGGGSGAFSIYFLKQNPNLRATIFDLPATIEMAKEYVRKYGVEGRVEFQIGDFETDEIRGSFDVIFLSHIVHSLSEEQNEFLFKKLYVALNPKGRLIVQDFLLKEDKVAPQFGRFIRIEYVAPYGRGAELQL